MLTKQNNVLGLVIAILAVLAFCTMDIIVTYLIRTGYPTSQVMFFRTAFAIPLSFAFILYTREMPNLRLKRPMLQLTRCVIGSFSMFLVFFAFGQLDLATVTALWSVNPIIVTIISFFILKEKVGMHRWTAVLIGFAGVLIISPPQTLNFITLIPFLAACCAAIAAVLLRILGRTDSAAVSTFYFAITSTIVSAILNIGVEWKTPSLSETVLLLSTAITGTIATLLFTQSFRIAEASLIMPIDYLGIVFLAIMAYYFFHEIPSWQTIIGATFITIAGLYTVYREIHIKRSA